jgi:hypothetical protein
LYIYLQQNGGDVSIDGEGAAAVRVGIFASAEPQQEAHGELDYSQTSGVVAHGVHDLGVVGVKW